MEDSQDGPCSESHDHGERVELPHVASCLRVVGILFVFIVVPAIAIRAVTLYGTDLRVEQISAALIVAAAIAFVTVGWQLALERYRPFRASVVRVLGASVGFVPTFWALCWSNREWAEIGELASSRPSVTFGVGLLLVGPASVGWIRFLGRTRQARGIAWSPHQKKIVVRRSLIAAILLVCGGVLGLLLYLRDEPAPRVDDVLSCLNFVPDDENGLLLLLAPYERDLAAEDEGEDEPWDENSEDEDAEVDPLDPYGAGFDPVEAREEIEKDPIVFERVERVLQMAFGPPDPRRTTHLDWEVPYLLLTRIPIRCRLAYEKGHVDAALADALLLIRLGKLLIERTGVEGHSYGIMYYREGQALLVWLLERVELDRRQAERLLESLLAGRIRSESFDVVLASFYLVVDRHLDELEPPHSPGDLTDRWLAAWYRRATLRPNMTRRLYAEWIREFLLESGKLPSQRVTTRSRQALQERCSAIDKVYYSEYVCVVPDETDILQGLDLREARTAIVETLVALLLYSRDHGELPEALERLVPVYLPSQPLDPFSGDALRYDRERQVIYSVGLYGVDVGPSDETEPPETLLDEYAPSAKIP